MTVPKIESKISIAGHPLHPMLVHLPIAALIGLIATDAAFIYTGDDFWARAGLWLSGVGALGGWGAALLGLIELLIVPRIRHLITGWSHAVIAVMMLSLATFNWSIRLDGAGDMIWPWGLGISLVTGVLVALAASLGGRLVYEHAVGVDTE